MSKRRIIPQDKVTLYFCFQLNYNKFSLLLLIFSVYSFHVTNFQSIKPTSSNTADTETISIVVILYVFEFQPENYIIQ